jgi:Ca2+/Na+ antiporter
MKLVVKKLRPIWSSNLSIIVASFNAAVFAKDAVEYTKNVTRYLHYILIAILVAIVLLVIRYFYKDHKEVQIQSEDQIAPEQIKFRQGGNSKVNEVKHPEHVEFSENRSPNFAIQEGGNDRNISISENTLNKSHVAERSAFNHPVWKITIGLVFSSVILLFLSGIILYKSQVYYVVLRNNIQTEREANDLVRMTNQALEEKGLKNLKALRLYKGKHTGQYLVTINGGYLVQSEAESVKNLLVSNGFNKSVNPEVKPSGAAFIRKLVYMNQFFRTNDFDD